MKRQLYPSSKQSERCEVVTRGGPDPLYPAVTQHPVNVVVLCCPLGWLAAEEIEMCPHRGFHRKHKFTLLAFWVLSPGQTSLGA